MKIELYYGKVKDTGYPIDGHILLFGEGIGGTGHAVIGGISDESTEAWVRTLHQTDELYSSMQFDEFWNMYHEQDYEPSIGVFTLEDNQVEFIAKFGEASNLKPEIC